MCDRHPIYFTQLAIKSLEIPENQQTLQTLFHYLFTDLCYYPFQGRILLNRDSIDSEINQLRGQLAGRFNNMEIRDVCYNHWLIIYLNYKSNIYLLNFISLKNTYSGLTSLWCDQS